MTRITGKMKRTTLRTTCRPSGVANPCTPAGRRAGFGRLVALAAALLVSPVLFAPTVLAHHDTGEVQLWASRIDFREAPDGVLMSVLLIERESGESVSGFGVRVAATGGGTQVGPIELQESEFAVYTGTLPLGPGHWEILATAHQGTSSLPAIESAHRRTLEIDAIGRLVVSASGGPGATTVLAIVLPICAVVLALAVVLRRRRLALDDGADADGADADGADADGDLGEDVPAAPASGGGPASD